MKIFPTINQFLYNDKLSSDIIGVFQDGILFPFEYNFKKDSNHLVFFFPGAFDRKKNMPKFQRSGYFKDLPYNCISFFDPTLFLSEDRKFESGWFQGNEENFYLNNLIKIVKSIVKHRKIPNSKILFFATSAGGIPAFKLACSFPESNVFLGNVQTNIFDHYPNRRDKMLSICYPEMNLETIKEKFTSRLSILKDSENINVYYAQNICDDFHLKNHFKPFLKSIENNDLLKSEVVIYKDEQTGHNPLPKEIELKVINNIFKNNSIKDIYDKFLVSFFLFNKRNNF